MTTRIKSGMYSGTGVRGRVVKLNSSSSWLYHITTLRINNHTYNWQPAFADGFTLNVVKEDIPENMTCHFARYIRQLR